MCVVYAFQNSADLTSGCQLVIIFMQFVRGAMTFDQNVRKCKVRIRNFIVTSEWED